MPFSELQRRTGNVVYAVLIAKEEVVLAIFESLYIQFMQKIESH